MHKPVSALSILLLLTPLVVQAQRPDSSAADTMRALRLQPLVVTVSKLPLLAQRNGFAVSVIGARDLRVTRPLYAADAVRNVAGAYIDEAVGYLGPTIVRLRGGEEVFTQILVDGVQMNQNGGFFDFQGLTLSSIDRVEVARGPQSAMWGSSAMTGVVNFITRPGEPGPMRWRTELERGAASERSRNHLGRAGFSGGGDVFRYSASAGRAFARGMHSLPHNLETTDAVIRLDLVPSSAFDLMTVVRGINVESKLPVRDPGATRAPLDPNAMNSRERLVGLLQARHQAGAFRQQARFSIYDEDFKYQDQFDDAANDGEFDFFLFDANFTFLADVRRTTAEYLAGFQSSNKRLGVSAGAQWEREALDEALSGDFGNSNQELDRDSRAAFAELQLSPSARLDVLVGSRFEKYDGLDVEHTPRASIVFAVVPERLRLRGAIARGFKAPNLQTQYPNNPFIDSNPDLAAESSTSYEGGADLTLLNGKLGLSATAFRQEFRNLIRTVAQPGSEKQINRNLGASDARGLEWEAAYALHRAVRLISSGGIVRTRIEDNQGLDATQYPIGESLPFRPDYNAMLGVEWQVTSRLSALLRGAAIGQQFVLTERFSGRRVEQPAYQVFGMNVNFDYSSNTTVYLRVENLFDRNYETAFDQRGQPLTATLGIRVGN
jgi:vitamin B12 transporter